MLLNMGYNIVKNISPKNFKLQRGTGDDEPKAQLLVCEQRIEPVTKLQLESRRGYNYAVR